MFHISLIFSKIENKVLSSPPHQQCEGGNKYFSQIVRMLFYPHKTAQARWTKHCCSVTKLCLTLVTPWTTACQTSLSFTISWSLLKPCPLSWWCPPIVSSSVSPFSSYPQSFPASGSFPMGRLFTSGGQSIGASASVLPMNTQGWFPLGLNGLVSLQSKGHSRIFSNITIQKHQFFSTQTSFKV